MFYRWTGESKTVYSLICWPDGQWELVSDVHRVHTKGTKVFRNSCGMFQTKERAEAAKKVLEGMK